MRPLLLGLMLAIGAAPQVPGLAQAPAPAAPKVQVTFEPNGLVTLSATGAQLRDVLSEWTRKGGTTFNGADKLTGPAVTLQYEHRPEMEVMYSLLRNAAGIVIAPREQTSSTGASNIGVVFILATSTPTMGGYSTPAYSAPQPQYSTTGSPDQEIQPVGPGRSGEPPQPSAPPPPRPADSGVSPVAVKVVPVVVPTAGTPPPTTPPTTTGPGRGGGGGGRR